MTRGPRDATGRLAAPPHLALYLPSLAGGGAERITLNLARALHALGVRVDLVLASATGPYLASLPDGVRLVDLGARRTLASLPALVRYLRRERPDGVLSAMNHANVVAVWAAALARFPGRLLVAEHNELPPRTRSAWQRAFNGAIGLTYPRADAVVAVSHGVKRSLIAHAGVASERIVVIYNPVIGHALAPTPRPRPADLPADGIPVVLGVGRLTAQKNFVNLLDAFAVVRRRRAARLVVLGEGPDRALLEARARDLGLEDDVRFPGFVPNPFDYLQHASVFALSSDWEGLPTVVIEALALGTPVVATDCPSGPREILDGGRFGHLVPVRDPEALAAALLTTLDAPLASAPATWLTQFEELPAARSYLDAFGFAGASGAADAEGVAPSSAD